MGFHLFFIWFAVMFAPSMALQQRNPFAWQFNNSSAATADRVYGSGDFHCDVPEPNWIHDVLMAQQFQSFGCHFVPKTTQRFGEARHPGPVPNIAQDSVLTVGVTNPRGLRQKEDILLGLGPGIWAVAETQLSQQTFRTSAGLLRHGARKMNREIRFHGGALAPLRLGSSWAGKWTGVGILSDVHASKLEVPWPLEHWDSGRVLLTRHWANDTPITVGTFYGYAQGPTWPKSQQLSDQLLETYTTELVMGMSGVRLCMGDFNQEAGKLTQQQIWMRHGWRNAQQVATEMFGHEPAPTCKGSTAPDQIWMSPEAIHLLQFLHITEDFMEHSTISIGLKIPAKLQRIYRWPRPAKIPWSEVDTADWDPPCSTQYVAGHDTTAFMMDWAHSFEMAVNDKLHQTRGAPLPNRCFGRSKRLQPEYQTQSSVTCKPSREGEVRMICSMAGAATRAWFKQLRRLQSYKHAILAGKQSPAALAYRAECWMAIRNASGFSPDFPTWWEQQSHSADGVPQNLPRTGPNESVIALAIYESFHSHFRAFESWHLQQRSTSLRMKYEGSLEAVFSDLRNDPKPGIDHFWKEQCYTILAVDMESNQVQLDKPVQFLHDSVWMHQSHMIKITAYDGDLCTVSDPDIFEAGDEIIQRAFITDSDEVLKTLEAHWRPRWSAMAQASESDWQRITQFAKVYMAKHHFTWQPISRSQWRHTAKQFRAKAARGPDGFDRCDLQLMPDAFVDSFLGLVTSIEMEDTPWPQQLTFGTVVGLAKHDHAHEEGHYRPITLFFHTLQDMGEVTHQAVDSPTGHVCATRGLGFFATERDHGSMVASSGTH